jgi:hypothetical protein
MAYALAASVNAENLSRIMNVVDALDELPGSSHNGRNDLATFSFQGKKYMPLSIN